MKSGWAFEFSRFQRKESSSRPVPIKYFSCFKRVNLRP